MPQGCRRALVPVMLTGGMFLQVPGQVSEKLHVMPGIELRKARLVMGLDRVKVAGKIATNLPQSVGGRAIQADKTEVDRRDDMVPHQLVGFVQFLVLHGHWSLPQLFKAIEDHRNMRFIRAAQIVDNTLASCCLDQGEAGVDRQCMRFQQPLAGRRGNIGPEMACMVIHVTDHQHLAQS